jgi:hypothetical protein
MYESTMRLVRNCSAGRRALFSSRGHNLHLTYSTHLLHVELHAYEHVPNRENELID